MQLGIRRICIVTGSRADFDLLRPLIAELGHTSGVQPLVVVTGMHLSAAFGNTIEAIHAAGIQVDCEVPCLTEGDGSVAITHAVSRALAGMADAFARLVPDVVVVLGDRFEILAAAQAAMLANIPLAHIHGGELTEGAVDESIRHAITKMASLHFVATPDFGRRVVQMGELPERVFVVGAPGVEAVLSTPRPGDAELEAALGLLLWRPTLVVTYHPVTCLPGGEARAVTALTAALERFPEARVVVTGVNADAGHMALRQGLEAFAARHPERVTLHASLGQRRYAGVLARADAVVGNSSSGLIEAPALGVPTVNLGLRQGGRPRAASVIDCAEEEEAIAAAIAKALDPDFRARCHDMEPPYGRGAGSARKMAEVLALFPLEKLATKPFLDLPVATC